MNKREEKLIEEIALNIQSWLDHQAKYNSGIELTDNTVLYSFPAWPTRGQLKGWIRVLREYAAAQNTPTERPLDSFGRDLREANLATMVKRLAHCLREDNEKLQKQAFDLLKRMDLLGPPLRSEYTEGTERRSGVAERRVTKDTSIDGIARRFGPQDRRQAPQSVCPICKGNDFEAACAYPSEGKEGCLRDKRLAQQPAGEDAELIRELRYVFANPNGVIRIAVLSEAAARIETLARENAELKEQHETPATRWQKVDPDNEAAYEQAIKENDDYVGALMYRGNTVSYIKSKADNYGKSLVECHLLSGAKSGQSVMDAIKELRQRAESAEARLREGK